MKAIELLKKDESAILIRTDGRGFSVNSDGSGSTGVWRIDISRKIQKVIIYKEDKSPNSNEVYIADHVDVSPDEDRYVISLANIRFLGSITENWYKFANLEKSARNPIRYLKG